MAQADPLAALIAFVKLHGTQKDAAHALGIGASYLSDLLNGNRKLPEWLLDKLGYETVIVKQRKS